MTGRCRVKGHRETERKGVRMAHIGELRDKIGQGCYFHDSFPLASLRGVLAVPPVTGRLIYAAGEVSCFMCIRRILGHVEG
ncbi:hypothetical protein E2C01_068683 [Portunus trituberculatus]|uniref:Uncharacterized protein n=1 Tax=Portunus trituberculatus TaxID=210409 RepID=A0A5B7HX72_PORTR|nr:hypothetical protein [Portunus trituberculatus]